MSWFLQQYHSNQLQKYLLWILLSAAVSASWPEALLTPKAALFPFFPSLPWLSPLSFSSPPPPPSFLKLIVLRLKADTKTTTNCFLWFETALAFCVYRMICQHFGSGTIYWREQEVLRHVHVEKFFMRKNCTNHNVKTTPDLRGAGHHQQHASSCDKNPLGSHCVVGSNVF